MTGPTIRKRKLLTRQRFRNSYGWAFTFPTRGLAHVFISYDHEEIKDERSYSMVFSVTRKRKKAND